MLSRPRQRTHLDWNRHIQPKSAHKVINAIVKLVVERWKKKPFCKWAALHVDPNG
jgi:hypothetical protein